MKTSRLPEARVPLRLQRILHGGDYNPDQWLHRPEVLADDPRLMLQAHCNAFSIGIFSWAALERVEGEYTFDWLDAVMERFERHQFHAILATPSAAMPQWMPRRYPEVMRVDARRVRHLPGQRLAYCFTSPVYRQKTREIARQLALRYKDHPALLLWHISNEYGGHDDYGACHCNLCQEAFRAWLKRKYGGDLDELNRRWWTGFWSHTYTEWDQIESPAPHGEGSIHGLNLDWLRFTTDQTIDFYRNEMEPLRELTPAVPITTNFMGLFTGLDYWKFARHVDVVCWDSYPMWHGVGEHGSRYVPFTGSYNWHADGSEWALAADVAFIHDLNRGLKDGQPWLLMENTPSCTNWQLVSKPKRPGMHRLSSLQAIAHGSDAVLYFQWRRGLGGVEKFHGAVVDHAGHEHTRVFREVAQLGNDLEKLSEVIGTRTHAEVAILCDWENRWAIDGACGPRVERRDYVPTCQAHYRPFWKRGISVDMIDSEKPLAPYKVVIAPMLHLVHTGLGERIEAFVRAGGIFVTTYWSGIVDENDLAFEGGYPGPLRRALGIWNEELDVLYDEEQRTILPVVDSDFPLAGSYRARVFCAVIHAEGAAVLARYGEDYYAGQPALTVNHYGAGQAYYIASRNDDGFTDDFCATLIERAGLAPVLNMRLPIGVTVQRRSSATADYLFVMNFTRTKQCLELPARTYIDLLGGGEVPASLVLEPYGACVLRAEKE